MNTKFKFNKEGACYFIAVYGIVVLIGFSIFWFILNNVKVTRSTSDEDEVTVIDNNTVDKKFVSLGIKIGEHSTSVKTVEYQGKSHEFVFVDGVVTCHWPDCKYCNDTE